MSVDLDGIVPCVEVKRKVSIVDPDSDGAELDISQVFHCDGLLLCKSEAASRFAVWNPFTEQIRWFHNKGRDRYHCLGYSNNNHYKRYKILSFDWCDLSKGFEIYELGSDSARILYDDVIPGGWSIDYSFPGVSLKGNTYLFAQDGKTRSISLLKFDFSREKFVPFPLPYQRASYYAVGISVVRDEKLSVLLEWQKYKPEIWVTNKIQSQVVSWSKILALDLSDIPPLCEDITFLLDEEKKVVMLCDRWEDETDTKNKDMIYIVGEDNRITQVPFGVDLPGECSELILNYVPTLAPIDQAGGKRKREHVIEVT